MIRVRDVVFFFFSPFTNEFFRESITLLNLLHPSPFPLPRLEGLTASRSKSIYFFFFSQLHRLFFCEETGLLVLPFDASSRFRSLLIGEPDLLPV